MQRFGLVVASPPLITPIDVDGAKAHSRILGRDNQDDYILDTIKEATDFLENETLLTLCSTGYSMTMDRFPTYFGTKLYPYDFVNSTFSLPRNPVTGISSIQYMDVLGVVQTLNPSQYQLGLSRWPARVVPVQGQVWPFTNYFTIESVSINFTAGYSSVNAIPARYKRAVKYLFAHFYENREPIAEKGQTEIPVTLQRIINSMRYAGFTQW